MQWHVRVVSCVLFLFILLFILHVILLFYFLNYFFFLSYSWHSVLLCITFMCKKKMPGWKFQGTRLGKCRCFLSWSCEWVNLGVGMVVSHLRVLHCPLFLMTLPASSKEYSCVNLLLPVPTCFHGRDYQKDLSSSQPEGAAQGCGPESLPLPSHTFLEGKKGHGNVHIDRTVLLRA